MLFKLETATPDNAPGLAAARGRGGARDPGTLALSTRKPWAIDKSCFTAVARPLYRTTPLIYYELML